MKITIEKEVKPACSSKPWVIMVNGKLCGHSYSSKRKAQEVVDRMSRWSLPPLANAVC